MAGIYHPSRGGVRGGQDQFKWEDVKNDKDKEYYIGHSLMVPTGQWTKGKDIFWYTRDKDKKAEAERTRAEEIRKVKELEARAMAAVLGKKTFTVENPLSKEEIKEVLFRGKTENNDASKIHGMGYKKSLRNEPASRYGTEFEGGDTRGDRSEKIPDKSSKKNTNEKRKHNSSDESEEELNKKEFKQKYKSEKKRLSYATNEKNLEKYPKNISSYVSQEKNGSSADNFKSGVKKSGQSSHERRKLSPSYSRRYKEESANSRKNDPVSPNDKIKYVKEMSRDRNRVSKHRERSPILRSSRRCDE